jgi:hypothetical protein
LIEDWAANAVGRKSKIRTPSTPFGTGGDVDADHLGTISMKQLG